MMTPSETLQNRFMQPGVPAWLGLIVIVAFIRGSGRKAAPPPAYT